MKRALLIGVALLGLMAASGIYVLNLITSDHLEFRKGELAYWLLVTSETISDWPHESPARYTYNARDGTSPAMIGLEYKVQGNLESVIQKLRAHCREKGYEVVLDPERATGLVLLCDAPDYRIGLLFDIETEAYWAHVVFVES